MEFSAIMCLQMLVRRSSAFNFDSPFKRELFVFFLSLFLAFASVQPSTDFAVANHNQHHSRADMQQVHSQLSG